MTDGSAHAAVSLRHVEKYYGAYHALRSIDLEIAPRERIVVCGPSGSGKSTLIRCMNMLEAPDAGEILPANARAGHDDVRSVRRVLGSGRCRCIALRKCRRCKGSYRRGAGEQNCPDHHSETP